MNHRPFRELTKHFTAKDWTIVDTETERIRKALDQRPTPAQDALATRDSESAANRQRVRAAGTE